MTIRIIIEDGDRPDTPARPWCATVEDTENHGRTAGMMSFGGTPNEALENLLNEWTMDADLTRMLSHNFEQRYAAHVDFCAATGTEPLSWETYWVDETPMPERGQ